MMVVSGIAYVVPPIRTIWLVMKMDTDCALSSEAAPAVPASGWMAMTSQIIEEPGVAPVRSSVLLRVETAAGAIPPAQG